MHSRVKAKLSSFSLQLPYRLESKMAKIFLISDRKNYLVTHKSFGSGVTTHSLRITYYACSSVIFCALTWDSTG